MSLRLHSGVPTHPCSLQSLMHVTCIARKDVTERRSEFVPWVTNSEIPANEETIPQEQNGDPAPQGPVPNSNANAAETYRASDSSSISSWRNAISDVESLTNTTAPLEELANPPFSPAAHSASEGNQASAAMHAPAPIRPSALRATHSPTALISYEADPAGLARAHRDCHIQMAKILDMVGDAALLLWSVAGQHLI